MRLRLMVLLMVTALLASFSTSAYGRISKDTQRILLEILRVFLVSSISPTPLEPESSLNLQYAPTPITAGAKNMTAVLVKPVFSNVLPGLDNQDEEPGPVDSIALKYSRDYSPHIHQSMLADITTIFTMHGFAVLPSVDVIDQIMPLERKRIDFIVILSHTIQPQVENCQTIYHSLNKTSVANVGTVKFKGNMTLEFKEPISGEIVLAKKIDVASLRANSLEQYENQSEAEDKCLELLNNIYPDLMNQIEKTVRKIDAANLQGLLKKSRNIQEKNL
jgi:hypothetical protein